MSLRKKLGVNIDHIATLRQARNGNYPDPVTAADIAEKAGADGITIHLREDRRHIQDRDVFRLRDTIRTRMNLEMAVNPEIIRIALKVKPDEVCLVPEKRREITTEGGLDVVSNRVGVRKAVRELQKKGIVVSLFVDPIREQIDACREVGGDYIEIHTGAYAEATAEASVKKISRELRHIMESAVRAAALGLGVNAGHGLNYENVFPFGGMEEIETLNIGHSIISRAVFTGLDRAVRDMKKLLYKD